MSTPRTPSQIQESWNTDPRWEGVTRPYTAEHVVKLRGTVYIDWTLARLGSERLWNVMGTAPPVRALGALTGNQAVQQVLAGLKGIYVSGWQVAADANSDFQTYPDQSLYSVQSVPNLVRRINRALQRADQIDQLEGRNGTYWFAPIIADAEAGFGGHLNAFELMKAMIEAGAGGVHFEDQLAAAKKCGHLGGKVLVPIQEFILKLVAARLAADVYDIPTVLIARTDANSARLITTHVDPRDDPFVTNERTSEGFLYYKGGIEAAIARGLAYAPHADLIWCETGSPDLDEAKRYAEAIHAKFPGKRLAYNCSPSFNWSKKLDATTIAKFQRELGAMGYTFQFVTLAGFHALNTSMFELAAGYKEKAMSAYSSLQDREFELADTKGYTAVRHQQFVGTGYFDAVSGCVTGGQHSTGAMADSTESEQFH
ncbi:MAG: isocitrate lyase [Planctomycetota bacterium]|jgi:isocitrate lyase